MQLCLGCKWGPNGDKTCLQGVENCTNNTGCLKGKPKEKQNG